VRDRCDPLEPASANPATIAAFISCGRQSFSHLARYKDVNDAERLRHGPATTNLALSGARRANIIGFGVPQHHGDRWSLTIIIK
jgi:hypothetical protein